VIEEIKENTQAMEAYLAGGLNESDLNEAIEQLPDRMYREPVAVSDSPEDKPSPHCFTIWYSGTRLKVEPDAKVMKEVAKLADQVNEKLSGVAKKEIEAFLKGNEKFQLTKKQQKSLEDRYIRGILEKMFFEMY
jgi:hypothetical protein